MKEFNKWYRKNFPLPPTIESGPITREFKNGCSKAWKAALKWVLDLVPDVETYDEIKEELEE